MVHEHDVVVVGAGPGGSAAAHYLSRHGLDVLLLDRSDFPRDKTCGDGLTPRALRVLDDMGILPDVRQRGCEVGDYSVVAPNGRHTEAEIPPPGALVVPRLKLDHLILQRGIASGAHFEPNVAVSHIEPTPRGVTVHADAPRASSSTRTTEFRAKHAVVATGAAFGVLTRSRILPRQPRAMLAARAYFRDLQAEVAQTFELRFSDVPMPGYGWVFPVGAREANIGIGFLPGKRTGTAHQAMERFSQGQHMRRLLAGARQDGPLKGYPIRVDFLRSPNTAPRTLLVGEAAGLVNPLTGEGIDYALESGKIAAEHLTGWFTTDSEPDVLVAYDRDLRARFGPIFRFSEIVRDWYCHPLLLNALVPLANSHPELRQLLARTVLGERQPAGYGPATMLARLVVYLVRTRTRSVRYRHD